MRDVELRFLGTGDAFGSGGRLPSCALVDLSSGADLFVCECSGYESAPPHHLDYFTLQRHASALTCRRLLLTHMGEAMLARAAALGVDVASDGLVLAI